MPMANRDHSIPASYRESLQLQRSRIDNELHADRQHASIDGLSLQEKKKRKLMLKDMAEGIRAAT